MGSSRIRQPLERFVLSLATLPESADSVSMVPETVVWEGYSSKHLENRVALALNPCELNATAIRQGSSWLIEATATVEVRYKSKYQLVRPRHRGARLLVEEQLFLALQELGWLHPYVAHWTWTLDANKVVDSSTDRP